MEKLHEFLGLSGNQIIVLEYIIMGLCQMSQSFFRSWNIQALSERIVWKAHVSWQLYGMVWIMSLTLGLKSIYAGDPLGIFIFFLSGGIGLHISMMTQKKNK